jgi:hypothetical protein
VPDGNDNAATPEGWSVTIALRAADPQQGPFTLNLTYAPDNPKQAKVVDNLTKDLKRILPDQVSMRLA